MTAPTSAQAAPELGAALPHRGPGFGLTALACGHARIVASHVPALIALWCPECEELRHQAPRPYTARQEYELRAAHYRAAMARLEAAVNLLTTAEYDAQTAAAALAELETRPGVPAYTQPGGGGPVGRKVVLAINDEQWGSPLIGTIVATTANPEVVMVQWHAEGSGGPVLTMAEALDELAPARQS